MGGMENRLEQCSSRGAQAPVTFFASNFSHGYRYAWPSACMKDGLYYGFLFLVEIQTDDIHSMHTTKSGDGTEVLLKPGRQTIIRAVNVFCNMPIKQGHPRNWDPKPDHELIPIAWEQKWANVVPSLL